MREVVSERMRGRKEETGRERKGGRGEREVVRGEEEEDR